MTTTGTAALRRTLGLRSLVLFGLAYLTPMIVLGIFGVIASEAQGASASAYLIALVAMLFTANSYGRLAAAFPVAGSAYSYVRRTIDARAGFLVGWAAMLDYLFLPMVIWLIGSAYLGASFPAVPSFAWIILFIIVTTALNIIGIKVADRVNFALMAFQVLVIVIFVALSIAHIVTEQGAGGLMSAGPFTGPGAEPKAIVGAAAIAAYSFLGFDAVTTLTEETVEPKRTVPRAIMLIALIGGGIFIAVAYATQLVHPGGVFDAPDSAAADIALRIGGDLFAAVFLAGLVIAQFTSGLAAQASGSRLLFAMGRDGVLPGRIFGRLSERFRTPVASILVIGAIGLIALVLDVTTSTSFINFGAFLAFMMVNVAVIALFFREREAISREHGPLAPLWYLVCPAIGALVVLFLFVRLDSNALLLGFCWLLLGFIALAVLTRGFRRTPPELSAPAAEEEKAPPAAG